MYVSTVHTQDSNLEMFMLEKKDIVCIMINTYSIIGQASGSKTENLNKYSSISFSVSCFKALNLKKKKVYSCE